MFGAPTTSLRNSDYIRILLFIPNVIGYVRLALLLISYFFWNYPTVFAIFYTASVSLDFFDGIMARKLNQCSTFGAWVKRYGYGFHSRNPIVTVLGNVISFFVYLFQLDVIIDNLSRGMLWANLFEWGWLVVSLEWITFVGNHSTGRGKWRDFEKVQATAESPPPLFVQMIMANGFKTPTGTLTILGLHVLPMWIYGMQSHFLQRLLPDCLIVIGCGILIVGRLLCMACELWCVQKYVKALVLEDMHSAFENQNEDFPDQNKQRRE